MPAFLPGYCLVRNSFLCGTKQVTGENLVPMTLQKQNVVTAVIADVLTPSAVWYIRCMGVHQTSTLPGSNISHAVVSLVVQQDANALWIGQVLRGALCLDNSSKSRIMLMSQSRACEVCDAH